jgi:hypothetical protein
MPENPYKPQKEGLDGYPEVVRRFAPHSKSISKPADFYRFVRNEGYSRMTALLLLRDLFNMNLQECMEVDAYHAGP